MHRGRLEAGATALATGAAGAGEKAGNEAAEVAPARRPFSPLSSTSNTKSALAGISGGEPRAPYPHAAEIRRIACSPSDIWGTP